MMIPPATTLPKSLTIHQVLSSNIWKEIPTIYFHPYLFFAGGSQPVPLTRRPDLLWALDLCDGVTIENLTKLGLDTRRLGPKRRYKSTQGTRNN
jgi:hypothetical protein